MGFSFNHYLYVKAGWCQADGKKCKTAIQFGDFKKKAPRSNERNANFQG
jgi:hypothetical protein